MQRRATRRRERGYSLIEIECDEGGVTVRSAGPDRRDGSDDDIIAPPEVRSASAAPRP